MPLFSHLGASQVAPNTNGRKRVTTKKVNGTSSANDNPPYYILVKSTVFNENIFYVGDESGCFSLYTYNITDILRTHGTPPPPPPPTAILINGKVDKEFEMEELATTKSGRNASKKPTASSYSIGVITFTLFKHSTKLFTCSQKIKVLPSWKPAFITLHPLTDIMEESKDLFTCQASAEINYAIRVLGAGGGNRRPFILNGLTGTVSTSLSASKTDFKMGNSGAANTVGTRSSVGIAKIDKENSITPGGDMNILPTIVADRNTRYTLEIPMNKKQTANGSRDVGSTRCDSEITLEIGDQQIGQNSDSDVIGDDDTSGTQTNCGGKEINSSGGEEKGEEKDDPDSCDDVNKNNYNENEKDKDNQDNDCIEGLGAKLCANGQSNNTVRCTVVPFPNHQLISY